MHKLPRIIGSAAAAAAIFTGTALAGAQDAWITTKAKLALLTTEGVSATAVNVDTVDNQITLHGTVGTAAEKDKAQAVVGKLDGVKSVRNLLQVVPESAQKAVEIADEQIKNNVEQALERDKSLDDSKIAVKSVNDGVVLLSGDAKSLTDHLRAVEVAAEVPGVRRIVTEIHGPDRLAAGEVFLKQQPQGQQALTYGDTARDLWITSATKLALLADGDTPALDINVDTRGAIVTLFGTVPSQKAKEAAGADAKKISGVKSVRNELEIVPSEKAKIVDAKDDQVKEKVETTLGGRSEFKSVNVEVKNGVARLTGKVPSPEDRLEAAILARSTSGVRSVRDELTISD